MYRYLKRINPNIPNPEPYPWAAFSLNLLGNFTQQSLDALLNALNPVRTTHNDSSPWIIGEWGTNKADFNPDAATTTYNELKKRFSTMYFFQHGQLFEEGQEWGATIWGVNAGEFTKTGETQWYPKLKSLYVNP
jgi:hypothetical protein